MLDPKYKAFAALNPFFEIVQQGLAGQVDGDHYFDMIAASAVFEFRYVFPGWPQEVSGRAALMKLSGCSCRNSRIRGPRKGHQNRDAL